MLRLADEFGPVLTSRFLGAQIREQIETLLEADGEIVVDLEGVEAVSPSFADELFAKLPREAIDSGRIRFDNVSEQLASLARFVINGRRAAAS